MGPISDAVDWMTFGGLGGKGRCGMQTMGPSSLVVAKRSIKKSEHTIALFFAYYTTKEIFIEFPEAVSV